ncbi:hypothetical protein ARAM_004565 [Aspergillus rambellii]|uniref:SUZ domain-containing protein n=1 Tax=Aspergillus rambellii TaxID=308745 RepID=A0A0F8X624_9EURO|nr:hypothetical protein ARAM_004565 [Aspergillus rambellii]
MSTKASMDGDAWEDDWESQADKLTAEPTPPLPEKKVSSKVTKAQRRAQQAEFNRQLWAEAESPQTFHFLETHSSVPLKQEFKPTVTLLSRNPQTAARQSSSRGVGAAAAGLGRLDLGANDDDDSDEDKRAEPTPEERHAIALRNLEEKQRKYEEARERLFGTPSAPTSGASSPRSATPPKHEGRERPVYRIWEIETTLRSSIAFQTKCTLCTAERQAAERREERQFTIPAATNSQPQGPGQ